MQLKPIDRRIPLSDEIDMNDFLPHCLLLNLQEVRVFIAPRQRSRGIERDALKSRRRNRCNNKARRLNLQSFFDSLQCLLRGANSALFRVNTEF